jgi:hypothetical protein
LRRGSLLSTTSALPKVPKVPKEVSLLLSRSRSVRASCLAEIACPECKVREK